MGTFRRVGFASTNRRKEGAVGKSVGSSHGTVLWALPSWGMQHLVNAIHSPNPIKPGPSYQTEYEESATLSCDWHSSLVMKERNHEPSRDGHRYQSK